MSTAPVTLDMSRATPIGAPQGVTLDLSKAVPIGQTQPAQPPGFFQRLGLGSAPNAGLAAPAGPSMNMDSGEGPIARNMTSFETQLANTPRNLVSYIKNLPQTLREDSRIAGTEQDTLGRALGKINPIVSNSEGVDYGATAANALPLLMGARQAIGAMGDISPLGDTVIKPRGTIPADAATPAELQAYADQNGIPLNAAQATEHPLPRNLQSAGERATVGGMAVKRQINAAQAAVAQHAEDLMDSFSPNTPDLATAGTTIQKGVQTALDREMANSRQAYAAIDQQAGGVAVDLKPLKQTAGQILNDSSFVRKAGALDQTRAASILQGIGNLPDSGTFSQAQQLRSALLDASRSPELAISNRAQAWIKQLTGTTDEQMMAAAQSKPDLESAFRDANDRWEQLQQDFNSPRSPLFQALQTPDPSKVPQLFTQRGQIGGSPYNAQLLDRYGINKAPVKWAITGDLLDKNFGLRGKNLGGYSDDFLNSLFSPDELSSLYKTGAIARSVGLNTNPSGTAAVRGAQEDVRHPIVSALPKAGAAWLTQSPEVNKWMMTPGQTSKPALVPPLPSKKRFQSNSDLFDQGMDEYEQRDSGRL